MFEVEPQDQYAFKKSPAVLNCAARFAAKLSFLCLEGNLSNEAVGQFNQKNVTTMHLEVHRRHLKVVGVVRCYCQAVGYNGHKMDTRAASVTLACKFVVTDRWADTSKQADR